VARKSRPFGEEQPRSALRFPPFFSRTIAPKANGNFFFPVELTATFSFVPPANPGGLSCRLPPYATLDPKALASLANLFAGSGPQPASPRISAAEALCDGPAGGEGAPVAFDATTARIPQSELRAS